jgi:AraC-like DNA-binding protein
MQTQLVLQNNCKELEPFPHINEFVFKKINTIQLDSFKKQVVPYLRIYYIAEGRFEWNIDNQVYILYPGDLAFILPGQLFGAEKDFFDIGTLSWIQLSVENKSTAEKLIIGQWSGLTKSESITFSRILTAGNPPVIPRLKGAGAIFQSLLNEFTTQEIGYTARINHLAGEIVILICRYLSRQRSSQRDFPKTFMKLEQNLRQNLSHQWSVEEMAAQVGLGTTAFSEKVKSFTGFSPVNYLINIRISEAIKLLKRPEISVTDIALDTGFYSSQHFATTFKKLTGYTPSEFRKKNIPDN